MRALEFNGELKFRHDFPVPEPEEGEALIRILIAGICNTDIEITRGYMGFAGILGHEFVGVVEKVNDKNHNLLGKRVVGEINCSCGICKLCRMGLKSHCQNREVLGIYNKNGCFAEYITMPVENLIEVPDSVSDEQAVLVEPLAAAFEIIDQLHIKPTDKILILGDGKLGLLISFVLKLTQADLLLVGKHKEKLDIAEKQGIKTILLDNLKQDRVYDIIVEATGSIEGFELAQKLVKPRGTIVLKSTVAATKPLNLAQIVIDEITVLGSRCGPFEPAVRALSNKSVSVDSLISKIFKFDEIMDAVNFSRTKGVLKVLVDFR